MKALVFTFAALLSVSAHAESICKTLDQTVSAHVKAGEKLKRFLSTQWKYRMTESPEAATYVGYPGQNDRWSNLSLATLARHRREEVCQLAALQKIPRQALSPEVRIDFDMMKRRLENAIEEQAFDGDYLILDHLDGLHMSIADLLSAMPTANKKDYENMLARLNGVPLVEEQTEALLREGLKHKVTPVKMFLARVPAQFDRVLTAKVEDSPIYQPFREINTNISATDRADLQKRALDVIENKVYPALKKLKTFVINEYTPGARESISFADMPKGKAWYAFLVRRYTTTKLTPKELHALGLKEVARIAGEMQAVREQAKFKGDAKAFNKFLLTDRRFYYTDKAELMRGYRDIAKRLDAELPKLFKTLPRLTYGVREMPEYKAKEAPGAYYEGGSLESGRPGYFTANTYDPRPDRNGVWRR
jgi:uncharacterized protein (DUF885 family)